MDSYSNDDKNIRINRFITAEFLPAVKKYKMARKLLENWTIETDATIYQFCAECSDKLYEAVEHFLREAIATDTNNIISLIGLCDKVKDDSRFYDIELSVFVSSETWNLLTALYENVKKGILIVADENNVSQSEIEKIQKEAQNSIFPVVLLSVSMLDC